MKKRITAMLLALCMAASLATAAFAEGETGETATLYCGKTEHIHSTEAGCFDTEGNLTCTQEEHTHSDDCYTAPVEQEPTDEEKLSAAVAKVQDLIAALPAADSITEENKADVEAQLDAINTAQAELDALLDENTSWQDRVTTETVEKYTAVCNAMETLNGQGGSQTPQTVDETPTTLTTVYVSSEGDDNNAGTSEAPLATLAMAVEKAADGATIYLQSNLTMTKCARFYDKHLTIDGQEHTVTRGATFDTQQDNARSTYNPAMIEVDGYSKNSSSLTLTNITLDDGGKIYQAKDKDGNNATMHYVQADSGTDGTVGSTTINGQEVSNGHIVQDAIIATYNGVGTITLGEGTTLKNFGGMSAVRVADGTLVMKRGSVICDDSAVISSRTRTSGDDGPAGAIWVQGGTVTMENGSEISNVVGRAIYVDGGTVNMGGTIKGLKYDANMWNGQGTAIHVRNGATVTMISGGVIGSEMASEETEKTERGKEKSAVFVCQQGSSFTMQSGSTIQNLSLDSAVKVIGSGTFTMDNGSVIRNLQNHAVLTGDTDNDADYVSTVVINGEITGQGNNVGTLQLARVTATVGPTGNIHDNNTSYGACYLQGGVKLFVSGTIANNHSNAHGGAIGASGQGDEYIEINDGAIITGNTTVEDGGGISLGYNAVLVMNGGTISGNYAKEFGGGVSFRTKSGAKYAQLLGGTIADNYMYATDLTAVTGQKNDVAIGYDPTRGVEPGSIKSYVLLSDKINLSDEAIYFVKDTKTVKTDGTRNVEMSNASTGSVSALTAASNEKGWSQTPLATFWAQKDSQVSFTVGGVAVESNTSYHSELPVYILTQKTNESGTPVSNETTVNVYAATVTDGKINFTLPASDTNGNGCAIAIVQPTTDYGTLELTGTETIKEDKSVNDAYRVDYTATYTMSKNLATQSLSNKLVTVTITLDPRTTYGGSVSVDSKDFTLVKDSVKYKDETKTLSLNLAKADTAKEGSTAEIYFDTWMQVANFKAGETLTASGVMTATIQANDKNQTVTVPSNVWKTDMTALQVFTITATADEGGSISPATTTVIEGEDSETFFITPDTGYEIADVKVNGESIGPVSSYKFEKVMADGKIEATFEKLTYTITANAGEGGSISPNGDKTVTYGDDVPYTITPADGYVIESVTVDGKSVGAVSSYTFTNVTADGTIEATFKAKTFTIIATAGEGGSISPNGTVAATMYTDVPFAITPDDGYVIESVTVDGKSAETVGSYTFSSVTSDHTISVTFAKAATPAPAETATPTPTAAPTAAPTTAPTATAAPSTSSTATATPAPTAAPKATATPAPVVPQTGDEFPYSVLIALAAVAAAGFGYTFYRKKKDN